MSINNIKVMGVGGGGSNTIDYISTSKVQNIETYAINTDAQALEHSKAKYKIHIGEVSTKGLGAGALPEIGRKAAEESKENLTKSLIGADIVFVAAGMGGGTGTGAAPYISKIAKDLGILTIGVVTKPFSFEGPSRMKMALDGLKKMQDSTDVTIVIPNEKLVSNHQDKFIEDAFVLPDDVLRTAIIAIIDLLENTSQLLSNVDLNQIKSTLSNKGLAVIGVGESKNTEISGIENTIEALIKAVRSDILEISVQGATEFIVQLAGDADEIAYGEIEKIGQVLANELNTEIGFLATIVHDPSLSGSERKITIIATGYENTDEVNKIVQEPERNSMTDLFNEI